MGVIHAKRLVCVCIYINIITLVIIERKKNGVLVLIFQ